MEIQFYQPLTKKLEKIIQIMSGFIATKTSMGSIKLQMRTLVNSEGQSYSVMSMTQVSPWHRNSMIKSKPFPNCLTMLEYLRDSFIVI